LESVEVEGDAGVSEKSSDCPGFSIGDFDDVGVSLAVSDDA